MTGKNLDSETMDLVLDQIARVAFDAAIVETNDGSLLDLGEPQADLIWQVAKAANAPIYNNLRMEVAKMMDNSLAHVTQLRGEVKELGLAMGFEVEANDEG